jgi:hypothetical protein
MTNLMRHIKILSYLIFALVCSYKGQAQSISGNPDRLPQEIKFWISTSKYKDAPKIADQFAILWSSNTLSQSQKKELQAILIQMPKVGFRNPVLAYFFIRILVHFRI